MKKHWLKGTVSIEPLLWNWYAWNQLIAPSTAGAHLRKRYLKILQSYCVHPALHEAASSDPKLIGGPYVAIDRSKMSAIETLIVRIFDEAKPLMELSEAIDQVSGLLSHASGFSLENFYENIPDVLAGCVELTYDMHHHADIRLIEALLYRQYCSCQGQTILLSQRPRSDRAFALSTPRFSQSDDVMLSLPFSSCVIDQLAQAQREPCCLDTISEVLALSAELQQPFQNLFTHLPPASAHTRYQNKGIRIRYFGHACILLETKQTSILIDPLIGSHDCTQARKHFSYLDLPDRIDYVLISHSHQDHFDLETLLHIRWQVKNIVLPDNHQGFLADPSLKLIAQALGFKSIITLREMETIQATDLCITALPFLGEHGDLNIHSKLAYHIQLDNRSFLFAVDSNNLDVRLYKKIVHWMRSIDVLFVGMECNGAPYSWTYGPLFQKAIQREYDQSRRLNGSDSEKVWQMIQVLQCTEVYIYAMGQEPWLRSIMGLHCDENSKQMIEAQVLMQRCQNAGIKTEKLFYSAQWSYGFS